MVFLQFLGPHVLGLDGYVGELVRGYSPWEAQFFASTEERVRCVTA